MRGMLTEVVKQKRNWLVAAGLLVLANSALFVYIDGYQTPKVINDQARWYKLRNQAAMLGRSDSSALFAKGKADLDSVRSRIPAKRSFPRVLSAILEKAHMSRVAPGKISYKPGVIKEQNLATYEIAMGVTGGYIELKCFLSELQEFEEMVTIDGISIVNGDPFGERLGMDIKITVYLRGEA